MDDALSIEVAFLRRQLWGANVRADQAARQAQSADRDLRTAEREIGDIEAQLRSLGEDI